MSADLTSPLVSIIVPAYNYESFIGETLTSIQSQTYQNWECIVIDDGSRDKTHGVVEEYAQKDQRIRCFRQRNKGAAAARNHGLRVSAGDYVQFWDADDFLEQLKIELQVEYLLAHPEVDIVYGNARYFSTEQPEERRYSRIGDHQWMKGISGTGKEMLASLIRMNIMVIEAPLIRRRMIEAVGYFDNRLNPLEDWEYFIRCATRRKNFQYIDDEGTLSLVRSHPASISNDMRRVHRAVLRLRKKIKSMVTDPDLLALNQEMEKSYRAMLQFQKGQQAIKKLKRGEWSMAAYGFTKMALTSRSVPEFTKLVFCALVSPFAPAETFDNIVELPARETMAKILRPHLRGSP